MKKFIALYTKLPWERKTLWTAAFVSLLPILASLLLNSSAPQPPVESKPNMDTYIPQGFVLVPIEVQNYEALDSILGKFGVVDLFQNAALVARNVRLLRAPQNPSHFAVLVAETDVSTVLKNGASFTVIVKRPEKSGTEFVKSEESPRRSIIYERE